MTTQKAGVTYVMGSPDENGEQWLAEASPECTCSPHYGHHEPYCGLEHLGNVSDLAKDVIAYHAAIRQVTKAHHEACLDWTVASQATLEDRTAVELSRMVEKATTAIIHWSFVLRVLGVLPESKPRVTEESS